MKEKRKGIFVFLGAFGITLAALGLLLLGSLAVSEMFKKKDKGGGSLREAYFDASELKEENDITFLWLLAEEITDTPTFCLFIDVNAQTGEVSFVNIDTEAVAEVRGNKATLSRHYEISGASGMATAVGNLLEMEMPLYILQSRRGFSNTADYFGGAVCNVSLELSQKLGIRQGTWKLDGEMIFDILTNKKDNGEMLKVLCQGVFDSTLPSELTTEYLAAVEVVFENSQTNISRYETVLRKTAVQTLAQSNMLSARYIESEYTPTAEGLALSQASRDAIKTLLK